MRDINIYLVIVFYGDIWAYSIITEKWTFVGGSPYHNPVATQGFYKHINIG